MGSEGAARLQNNCRSVSLFSYFGHYLIVFNYLITYEWKDRCSSCFDCKTLHKKHTRTITVHKSLTALSKCYTDARYGVKQYFYKFALVYPTFSSQLYSPYFSRSNIWIQYFNYIFFQQYLSRKINNSYIIIYVQYYFLFEFKDIVILT